MQTICGLSMDPRLRAEDGFRPDPAPRHAHACTCIEDSYFAAGPEELLFASDASATSTSGSPGPARPDDVFDRAPAHPFRSPDHFLGSTRLQRPLGAPFSSAPSPCTCTARQLLSAHLLRPRP